ncbi:MAG: aminotransferase [Planktotalea sp.]|jgi:aspartate/methionine/tyrosine aminotransferase|uniref:aminotransferase n=1 Tax=Planktotalea sp. TaxID=2029877 RepID=UPI00018391C5|nr:aminotransferase [Planktotalea sp.]EDZ42083.1 aminotransferase, classes I and II [Rhodobacteraceae bacterium HTCC2083]MBT5821141.1 aminotransferase [Paracoccaceae bacterium]MDG1077104.1 aminotransferase [Planktotalea sp.]MDG1085892.1 aminotransferase [Planktotalea sp.]
MGSATEHTFAPPVMEARRWLEGVTFLADRPLINVSQAAPVDLPPEQMRAAMADIIVNEPQAHLYGPVIGLPELRAEVATQWSAAYGASLTADNVAITSGCNQAFAAAISAIAQSGDEVLLPAPWYFNHKMWLDMASVTALAIPTDAQLLPDPEATRALITERTRAISLVTPNNPAGVEYPPELVLAFFKLAQETGIKLIIDETYRDFHSQTGAPHGLFQQADWDQTLIHLYSFSKAFRLTGHRVGALISSPDLLAEAEKFLDTVAICPNQIGQFSALWGLRNLTEWLAGERFEILARRATIEAEMPALAAKGWTLKGCGAYFAYLEHPFEMASDVLAQKLVEEASILALPGTMFMPENEVAGQQHLRIAFANVDATGIAELFTRLKALRFSLAPPRAGK